MIQIINNKNRAVFQLEDNRRLVENSKGVHYEFVNKDKSNVAFYRYADSSAFLFAEVNEIALEGKILTPETAEEELSKFFEKTESNSCGDNGIQGEYIPLSGSTKEHPITGPLIYKVAEELSFISSLEIHDTTLATTYPVFSIDYENRTPLSVIRSATKSILFTSGENSKWYYCKSTTTPWETNEIAVLGDIITVTDGGGTKFLADDGTYKNLPGIDQLEETFIPRKGVTSSHPITGDLHFSHLNGNALSAVSNFYISSATGNVSIDAFGSIRIFGINGISIETGGMPATYKGSELATLKDIPDYSSFVINSSPGESFLLLDQYKEAEFNIAEQKTLDTKDFTVQSNRTTVRSLDLDLAVNHMSIRSLPDSTLSPSDIETLFAMDHEGNCYKISLKNLKDLLAAIE